MCNFKTKAMIKRFHTIVQNIFRWKSFSVQKEMVKVQRTFSVRSQTSYEVLKSNEEQVQPRQRTNSIRSHQKSYDTLKNFKECPWVFESSNNAKF